MSAPRYFSDRARREIAILPRILWAVCRQEGALADAEDGEDDRLRAALTAVNDEVFAGLLDRDADKLERQICRVTKAVIVGAGLEDAPNAKVVAAVWQVLAHLVEHGALEVHEGSPMADAAARIEPAHAHVYESPALARSAEKTARRLLRAMQAEGLWTAVPAMGALTTPTTEAAE